ncbi:uncharacterized protein LOC134036796 [Osmerus eperlanus]|uniref:uncharacterized protein LOC134036796 n=1 Tax=Osmerus eperlanus TaxID=29151 RepID=UPI002E1565C1
MMRLVLDCLRTPRQRASNGEREKTSLEQDERVIQKTSDIRELEDAVQVEGIELQEQHSDKLELEQTLERLEKHRAELEEQIKRTRLQCFQESQEILSLQAEEVKRETTVEEYEWELARARRRLKRLKEEVRSAQQKVEEAGERTVPLQEAISQSYEEILEEERRLQVLSGERPGDAALTPDFQKGESEDLSPPSCTTEEVPVRPWGRSQSLPAYADVILRRCGSSCLTNNPLSETQEDEDEDEASVSSTPKIIPCECGEEEGEEEEEEGEKEKEVVEVECVAPTGSTSSIAIDELDFYHPDPFVHCETEHNLFKDDLFPKTATSDVFADDPFKGTDPFAADVLFPERSEVTYPTAEPLADSSSPPEAGLNDEGDTSLSCAENKASTGTQCFESEFPDEDESSDIEISYSREDLDTVAMGDDPAATSDAETLGFKPIQAPRTMSLDTQASDQAGPEGLEPSVLDPSRTTRSNTWASQPNYSTESDPNGYEFDINAVSPPSDIEELSLGSMPASYDSAAAGFESRPNPGFSPADSDTPDVCGLETLPGSEEAGPDPDQPECLDASSPPGGATSDVADPPPAHPEPQGSAELGDGICFNRSQRSDSELDSAIGLDAQSSSEHNSKFSFGTNSFEFSYEPSNQASFDPYGFKLSPEHNSIQDILDPYGSDLGSEPGNNASFDPYEFKPSSSQPDDEAATYDPYGFDLLPQRSHRETSDPYGFKLSPETDTLLHFGGSADDAYDPLEADNNNTPFSKMDPFSFELQPQPDQFPTSNDLLGLELSNTVAEEHVSSSETNNPTSACASSSTSSSTTNMAAGMGCDLLGGDLDSVFGTGVYVACDDVADDLEPFEHRVGNPEGPPLDNRVVRAREAAHSESSDTVADWMTVRSNSKESFGPVNSRTCSLDK